MKENKISKKAVLVLFMFLFITYIMCIITTYAYFTTSITSTNNKITMGSYTPVIEIVEDVNNRSSGSLALIDVNTVSDISKTGININITKPLSTFYIIIKNESKLSYQYDFEFEINSCVQYQLEDVSINKTDVNNKHIVNINGERIYRVTANENINNINLKFKHGYEANTIVAYEHEYEVEELSTISNMTNEVPVYQAPVQDEIDDNVAIIDRNNQQSEINEEKTNDNTEIEDDEQNDFELSESTEVAEDNMEMSKNTDNDVDEQIEVDLFGD